MTGPALEATDVLAGVVVDVGGLAVALGAADPDRAEAVASLFRHAPRRTDAPTVHVRFEVAPGAVPTAVPSTSTPHADLWHDGPDRLVVHARDGLTAIATADALVVGGDVPGLAREFRFVALLALSFVLARHDRHLLHGAALLVGDGDGAVVVLGNTGTGKSTLAFAAHRLGWAVLADDAVMVRPAEGGVRVRGVPRPVAVAADVATDVAGGRPVPEDARDRTELPPGTLAPGEHPVVAVAVTTGSDPAGPGIDPLPGMDVLRAVLQASVSVADAEARPGVFAVAGVLARLPHWSLRHGADPTTALEDATAQLVELARLVGGGS